MFGPWLEHYFGWSSSAAGRFMQAAQVFGEFPNLGDLTIDQSALYLLSSDSCPDEVRGEVLDAAKAGARITHKAVKAAIEQESEQENINLANITGLVSAIERLERLAEWDRPGVIRVVDALLQRIRDDETT